MAHTPGPWEIREIPALNVIAIARVGYAMPLGSAAHWVDVCEIPTVTDVDRANARLMAAAPDLLASLEAVLPMAIADVEEYGGNPDTDARIIAAREAIAKATRP